MTALEVDLKHRTLDLLRASADANGRGHVTNRALGQRLGCSIANFPRLWVHFESLHILVREHNNRLGTTYRLLAPGEEPTVSRVEPLVIPPHRLAAKKALSDLERLSRLKERGHLTEREYVILKRRLVADDGSE